MLFVVVCAFWRTINVSDQFWVADFFPARDFCPRTNHRSIVLQRLAIPARWSSARRTRDDGDRSSLATEDVLHGRGKRRLVSYY